MTGNMFYTYNGLIYHLNIVPISFGKSYGLDPLILHSLVSGCVEALK